MRGVYVKALALRFMRLELSKGHLLQTRLARNLSVLSVLHVLVEIFLQNHLHANLASAWTLPATLNVVLEAVINY